VEFEDYQWGLLYNFKYMSENESTFEDLLWELIAWVDSNQSNIEEIPTSPVFPDTNKETQSTESEDYITEAEIEDLEKEMMSAIEEMEQEIQAITSEKEALAKEKEELSNSMKAEITAKEEELKTTKDLLDTIEESWSKIQDIPVLGKLVQDALEWKEVSIPKMIEEKVTEDINSMPNIEWQAPVSIQPEPLSFQSILDSTNTADFSKF